MTELPRPELGTLRDAVEEAARLLARAEAARGGRYLNRQGGDVAATGNLRSLVRHVANYAAAAELAEAAGVRGTVVDVGSGVGALGCWLAGRLGCSLVLVDADESVLAAAKRAFPHVEVSATLDAVEAGTAGLVTAMEVIEHVPRPRQLAFVQALAARLTPGGLLVCSTPDESGYLGRWSGYAPHVGVLDAAGLDHLLRAATGGLPAVWRLSGPAFDLGGVRRVLEPAGNRLWAALHTAAPRLVPEIAARGGRAAAAVTALAGGRRAGGRIPDRLLRVRVDTLDATDGTGLLGAVPVERAVGRPQR